MDKDVINDRRRRKHQIITAGSQTCSRTIDARVGNDWIPAYLFNIFSGKNMSLVTKITARLLSGIFDAVWSQLVWHSSTHERT